MRGSGSRRSLQLIPTVSLTLAIACWHWPDRPTTTNYHNWTGRQCVTTSHISPASPPHQAFSSNIYYQSHRNITNKKPHVSINAERCLDAECGLWGVISSLFMLTEILKRFFRANYAWIDLKKQSKLARSERLIFNLKFTSSNFTSRQVCVRFCDAMRWRKITGRLHAMLQVEH